MKTFERTKIRTVHAETAEEFDREFNKATNELPAAAQMKWEDGIPFCVHFIYHVEETRPETMAEKFQLQGIEYKCRNCPMCRIGGDKRKKMWPCEISPYGKVCADGPACDYLYKGIMNGTVDLIEDEEE